MRPGALRLFLILLFSLAAGCSGRQLYDAGVGWRQTECQKILDNAERERCLRTANTDYDTYGREKAAAGAK